MGEAAHPGLGEEAGRLCGELRSALQTDASRPVAGTGLAGIAAEIRARLRGGRLEPGEVAELSRALVELTRVHGAVRRRPSEARLAMHARVDECLTRLRRQTRVTDLIPAAIRELAGCCELDRVVVSRLLGATLRTEGVLLAPGLADRRTEAALWEAVPRVEPGGLEADLIRGQTAAHVLAGDPRAGHPITTTPGGRDHLASPIMAAGRVIGFVHATRGAGGAPLADSDADALWTFAAGLGLLLDRATLLERLAAQRVRVHAVFSATEQDLRALDEGDVLLSRAGAFADAPGGGPQEAGAGPPQSLDQLTAREHQVMVLMASGARNAQIADRLGIGATTVKSHVATILRKLGVATRAEAVSEYMTLVMGPRA